MFCTQKEAPMGTTVTFGEWWYNTTYHESTKMTPYEEVYGQQPPSIVSYIGGTSKLHAINSLIHNLNVTLCALKENLAITQNHMNQHEA